MTEKSINRTAPAMVAIAAVLVLAQCVALVWRETPATTVLVGRPEAERTRPAPDGAGVTRQEATSSSPNHVPRGGLNPIDPWLP